MAQARTSDAGAKPAGKRPLLWPDLTPYGMRLQIGALTGRRILVVRGLPNGDEPADHGVLEGYSEQLSQLGFNRHPSGIWIQDETKVFGAHYLNEFPKATLFETSAEDVTVIPGIEPRYARNVAELEQLVDCDDYVLAFPDGFGVHLTRYGNSYRGVPVPLWNATIVESDCAVQIRRADGKVSALTRLGDAARALLGPDWVEKPAPAPKV